MDPSKLTKAEISKSEIHKESMRNSSIKSSRNESHKLFDEKHIVVKKNQLNHSSSSNTTIKNESNVVLNTPKFSKSKSDSLGKTKDINEGKLVKISKDDEDLIDNLV